MTRRLPSLMFAVAAMMMFAPSSSFAQFETPNRSFHNATAFRLDGKHQTVRCEACHLNGQFRGTPTTCYECHWIRRKDDRFQTRLGTQCEQCHRPTSWTAVRWDHAGQAGVPLNVNHRQLNCESCHASSSFRAAAVTCIACHQKDFSRTTAPSHTAAGFPTTCDACHLPGDPTWRNTGGQGFNHNSIFPLVGVHATQACVACHRNNVYKGTPRDCVGCHQAQYNATTNPNHAAAGFPTTCDACHKPTDPSWTSAQFNHNAFFPLVGVHATQACAACHRNNVYKGTSRDCVGCHLSNYNSAQNPNHLAAGFPTACDQCHNAADASWAQGRFSHTQFPLIGSHNVACAQCHLTPNNFASFSCTVCHDRARTDSQHNGRSGYVYDSNACYSCHPNGRAD